VVAGWIRNPMTLGGGRGVVVVALRLAAADDDDDDDTDKYSSGPCAKSNK
jgi:hypothetical protein